MGITKSVANSIRKNPIKAAVGSFLWAAVVAFLMSPGVIFNLFSSEPIPLGIKNDFNEPFESSIFSAIVHAFIISFLILPGQVVALS